MLPVAGKPVIWFALDEARQAEVDQIVLVSSPLKEEMNDYFWEFDYPKKLVIQPEPTGLAPAVLMAGLDEDSVVLLPDALYHPGKPSGRIARMVSEGYDVVLFTEAVDDQQVKRFGIFEPETPTSKARILEKPMPTDTASRRAIGGRYGFTKLALRTMAISLFEDPQPDLPLTPTINYAMQQELQVLHLQADPLEVRYDCGSIRGYQRAQREVV